jgi:hypothetical protein
MNKKTLCKFGLHRPLKIQRYHSTDIASGKTIFIAVCPCGKQWMVSSKSGWFGFKKIKNYKK